MENESKNYPIQAAAAEELAPFMPMMFRARKPDVDFIHTFRMPYHKFVSAVKVEIWMDNGKAVVMFTDIDAGVSITNSAEVVITGVYDHHLLPLGIAKENCLFMETYDKYHTGIDLIMPEWAEAHPAGWEVVNVTWRHLGVIVG